MTGRIAAGVMLGILGAALVLFVVVRATQPSELDCAGQRADVALGERSSVDPACRR